MRSIRNAVYCLILTLLASGASAATSVSGTLGSNTTWTLANSPYVVTSSVTISAGVTLTIEPGVAVTFNTGTGLAVSGTLNAVGTATSRISFTSSSSAPSAGAWRVILLQAGSSQAASQIAYADVSYGGANGASTYYGAINVTAGAPVLTDVVVSNSSKSGIYAAGAATSLNLTRCRFTANTEYGINIVSGASLSADQTTITNNVKSAIGSDPGTKITSLSSTSASGNGADGTKNVIDYRGGTISAAETWRNLDLSRDVANTVSVAAGAVLTIDPGAVVRFNSTSGLAVSGSVKAIGTASNRITFTSTSANPGPGSWRVILLQAGTTQPVTEIAYADVSHGGASGAASYYGGIHVTAGAPVLTNVAVSNSSKSGIYATGTATTLNLTGCQFTGNTEYGINIAGGATLNSDQTTLTTNGKHAVGVDAGTKLMSLSNMTASGNGSGPSKNAIEHRGGNLSVAETWRKFDLPWELTSSGTVAAGAILTVDPGTVVRFNSGCGLAVNGSLKAIGTASNRITFTSVAATPTAGSWRVILLQGDTTQPVTEIAHAEVLYGGASGSTTYYGGIHVTAGSPVLTNVTVANSSKSGIYATGAGTTLSLTGCRFDANAEYGIHLVNGAAVTGDQTTITNNGKSVASADSGTKIVALSNTTATGNARNVLEYRGGTISVSDTWKNVGVPWEVMSTTTVASGAVLTVEAGVAVLVASSTSLVISGSLQAIGTPLSRITFTSAAATPTAGSWRVILMQAAATELPSRIAYADISYGGANGATVYYGNIHITSGVTTLEHVTVANSSKSGVYVSGTSTTTTISHSAFTGNASHGLDVSDSVAGTSVRLCAFSGNASSGIRNGSAATVLDARFNYWGAATGPSAQGSGSGQSITTGVLFEPWIAAFPAQAQQYFTSAAHVNRSFNPEIDATSIVDFGTVSAGAWSFEIRDGTEQVVRTYSGSGSTGSVEWDGRNNAGLTLASGNYAYVIASTDANQVTSTAARGIFVVDTTKSITVTSISITEAYFSPNADLAKDTTSISAAANYQTAEWSVEVLNASGLAIRNVSGVASGSTMSWNWDGTGNDGAVQADGTYTLVATASVAGSSASRPATTRVDTVLPAVAVSQPVAGTLLSNVHSNGAFTFSVVGSISDTTALANWTLDYGTGAAGAAWTTLTTGTTAKANATLLSWATRDVLNGDYQLRLRAWDAAGNLATVSNAHKIGHLTATPSAYHLQPVNGGTVTYTSTVPFSLSAVVTLKNASGGVVRTLFSGVREAGTYGDVWDGRDDAGNAIADGPYFFAIAATAGTSSTTFDETAVMRGTGEASSHPTVRSVFDPYNNKPQAYTWTITDAYRIVLEVTTSGNYTMDCTNRTGCLIDNEYSGPGTYTYYWAGTSRAGAFLDDRTRAGFHYSLARFPRSVTVVYGTKPVLGEPFVAPALYSPSSGQQTISFDLATYQSAPVALRVRFLNQASMSVLRTINIAQQSAGRATVTWDGRADNGSWVAPGDYTVMIDATDALGNTAHLYAVTSLLY